MQAKIYGIIISKKSSIIRKKEFISFIVATILLLVVSYLCHAAPLITVGGLVTDENNQPMDNLTVVVRNPSRNLEGKGKTGNIGPGRYSVLLFDYETNNAAQVGDVLEITFERDAQTVWSGKHTVTAEELNQTVVVLNVQITTPIPELQVTGIVIQEESLLPVAWCEVVVQLGKSQKRLTTDMVGYYTAVFSGKEAPILIGDTIKVTAIRGGGVIGQGQHTLTKDDLSRAAVTIDLTVSTNLAPRILKIGSFSVVPGVPLSFDADEGKLFQLEIVAEDPDSDTLKYQIEPALEGARFEGNQFLWTPSFNVANAIQGSELTSFSLAVTDGKLSDSSAVQVRVRNISKASKLDVKLASASLVADGTATTQVTIHVTDVNGEPVTDEQIRLSVRDGAVVSPVVHKANGDYVSAYTAGIKAGSVTLTVEASNGRTGQTTFTLVAGPPRQVRVALEKTYLVADGKSESQVSVTVTDAYDNGVSGLSESLTILVSQGSGSVSPVTERGNGNYTAIYTAGFIPERVVINAKTADGIESKGDLTLGADPTGFLEFSTISATSPIPADNVSQSKITVTIRGKDKQPVSGKQIEIRATGSNNTLVQPASSTDIRGQAVGYLASETAELKHISAYILPEGIQLTDTATVEFRPSEAYEVEIYTEEKELIADGKSSVLFTVTVKDIFGNLLSWDDLPSIDAGQKLTVYVNDKKQSLEQRAAKDASVELLYTAPEQAGEQVIRVSTANGKIGSLNVNFNPPSLPEIIETSVEGSPAAAGEKIVVVLVGPSASTASFSFEGIARATNLPMVEQAPGYYVGQYTAIEGDNVTNGTVVITLSNVAGAVKDSSKKVTIDTIPPPAPTNLAVRGGKIDLTNQSFVEVTGTSSPGRGVIVTMTGPIQGTPTDIQPKQTNIVATATGTWYANFDATRFDDGTVTVHAREENDEAGNSGLAAQLTVVKNTEDRPFHVQVAAPTSKGTPGQSLTYRLYVVVGPAGYGEKVVFRIPEGLPAGVKYTYQPQDTVTPTADEPFPSLELTLSLPADIKAGEYSFRVLVTTGLRFEELKLSFGVEPPAVPLTIEAAPREIRYDQTLQVQGILELPESFSEAVDITLIYVAPDGSEQEQLLKTQPFVQGLPSSEAKGHRYTTQMSPADFRNIGEPIGLWRVTATWEGEPPYAAVSRGTDFVVSKGISQIEWLQQEETSTVKMYEEVSLPGKLHHSQRPIENVSVQIIVRDSKGVTRHKTEVSTNAQGEFAYVFPKSSKDIWSITAAWPGNRYYEPSSDERSLEVVQEVGKAILVLGGGDEKVNEAWDTFNGLAQYVYRTLKRRHLTDEDIYFLSPAREVQEGVDGPTTIERVEYAITKWAPQHVGPYVPLYIYLLSHNVGTDFLLEKEANRQEYLTPQMLNAWLNKLPEQTPVLLIVEACYSGNFIKAKENGQTILPSPNRVIITSTRDDFQAKIQRNLSSFTRFFFDEIQKPQDVLNAFDWTTKVMERYPQHRAQFPMLEATGDSIANQQADYNAVAKIFIPDDTPSLGEPPQILKITPSVMLKKGESSYTIRAQVQGPSIEWVRASIVPPDYDPYQVFQDWKELAQPVEVELTDPNADGWYEGTYTSFTVPGEYKILVDVKNEDGYAPMPGEMSVMVPSLTPWDTNNDGKVDILDIAFVVSRFGEDSWEADLNGDGTVDILDLVLIGSHFGKSSK
jgi:hypothetical protein